MDDHPESKSPVADEQEEEFQQMKDRAGMGHFAEVLKWIHWSKARPGAKVKVLVSRIEDEEVSPAFYMGNGKWRHAYYSDVIWEDSEIVGWVEWPAGPQITRRTIPFVKG
jgi:hypothetical protein